MEIVALEKKEKKQEAYFEGIMLIDIDNKVFVLKGKKLI